MASASVSVSVSVSVNVIVSVSVKDACDLVGARRVRSYARVVLKTSVNAV